MERKYAAFISYRHAELDSAVAKTLHSLIEQYRIPKSLRKNGQKKFGIVFRDEEELSATNDLTDKIYTALDNSEHLVVICTKATLQSPWVSKEVEHFLTNHDRSKAHIVLADGEPMEVFPHPLTHTESEGGIVTVTEPMAVDIRAESIPATKKKLKREILRLFAAMLGCPYDTLAMREQRRKRQSFAAVMSLILAIAIGFSTVLLVKNYQIDQKNEELDKTNTALEEKNNELDQKNAELEQKNDEVLLRESELLTSNSVEALKEGDKYSAIYNAVTALPTYEEDRPYYAQSETALLTALNPFGSDSNYMLTDTVLEQMTPVTTFRISEDGTHLATIDPYSVVTMFDTVTGETLGTVQLSSDTVYMSTDITRLLPHDKTNSVIAFDGVTIAAVSYDTCEILWSHTDTNATEGYIVQSPDSDTLAYISTHYNADSGTTSYELVFLSSENGQVLQTIPFAAGRSAFISGDAEIVRFTPRSNADTINGCFSKNGLFATTYLTENNDETHDIHYVVADIEAGTCEEVCSFTVSEHYTSEDVYFIYFSDNNTSIVCARETPGDDAMVVEKISLDSGKLLWKLSVPSDEGSSYFQYDDPVRGLYSSDTAYIMRKDRLYFINTETGEHITTRSFKGTVIDTAVLENSFFGYATTDGYYAVAWFTSTGISDTGSFGDIYFNLGEINHMRLYNGGPLSVNADETGSITSIAVGNEDDDMGYIAVVPAANDHSVVIKRICFLDNILPTEQTGMNDGASYQAHPLNNGMIALGPFSNSSGYSFKIVSADSGNVIKELSVTDFLTAADIYFLPDASGFIESNNFGDITLYGEDGTSTVLSEANYILFEAGSTSYYDIGSTSSSAILSDTGTVLTALCADETLTIWTNGGSKKELSLPEDLTWLGLDLSIGVNFLLEAGSNGSIVVSDFDDEDFYVDRFGIYNTNSGTWSYIENDGLLFSDGIVCLANTSQKLAILDDNSTVFLYDTAGNLQNSFPLQLPYNSVRQMEFILDDEYMLVTTTDSQLLIFQVSTGSIVYRESNISNVYASYYPYVDRENHRLYLAIDSFSSNGICIDLLSWTKLIDIPGLIYFNGQTGEMYRNEFDTTAYSIITQVLPATKELSKIVRELLGI